MLWHMFLVDFRVTHMIRAIAYLIIIVPSPQPQISLHKHISYYGDESRAIRRETRGDYFDLLVNFPNFPFLLAGIVMSGD